MSQILYNFRIPCITENEFVTCWGTNQPTACPNGQNHVIDANGIVVLSQVSSKDVVLQNNVPGYFQLSSIAFPIDANSGQTVYDISYPFDMNIWTSIIIFTPVQSDDVLNVILGPNTMITSLIQDGNVNDTILTVDPLIFEQNILTPGLNLVIQLIGQMEQNLGRILSFDKINRTITIENPLTNIYPSGSNILLNVHLIKDLIIPDMSTVLHFGLKGFATKIIQKGTIIRFIYTNNSQQVAKKFNMNIEYNFS